MPPYVCWLLTRARPWRQASWHPDPAPPKISAELARTTNGVAHIRANDFRGLGYGLAYAYAQDNVCMFADSLLTARGERSLFFGPMLLPLARSAVNMALPATSWT